MTSPAMPSMRQVKRVSAVLIWVDNRVSRFAISVRTSPICAESRVSRLAISVRTSAIPPSPRPDRP